MGVTSCYEWLWWLRVVMSGYMWLRVVTFGSGWLRVVMSGYGGYGGRAAALRSFDLLNSMIQWSRWSDELQWATKGNEEGGGVGGSVIKIFWSIDLHDLLIHNNWFNIGAIFIPEWSCFFNSLNSLFFCERLWCKVRQSACSSQQLPSPCLAPRGALWPSVRAAYHCKEYYTLLFPYINDLLNG